MSDSSARLALPFILPAQAQKHVTHNEAIERLDLLVQLTVEEFGASAPPNQPAEGAVWALGPAPTGAWDGEGDRLAARVNGGWMFITPQPGWTAAQGSDLRIWDGTDWVAVAQAPTGIVSGLGINTSFDMTNRLAVASDATLLTHDGQGHQLKLNKNSTPDTASLLFQTDWSGHAEMGLTGSNAFEVKVSADGANWHTALQTDPATGQLSAPNGAQIAGVVTGPAVTQSGSDTTPGRLLTTGAGPAQAFRRGNILGAVSQSGGVPTGAIIQRGSNANGEFVRFADGTQFCWHLVPLTFSAGSLMYGAWVYPAVFLGSFPIHVSANLDNDSAISGLTPSRNELGIIQVGSGAASAAQFGLRNVDGKTSFGSSDTVSLVSVAIGRWF